MNKMILIDVNNNQFDIVEVEGLDDYYKALSCSCVNIIRRKIDGKPFVIICDDEGFLARSPKISAIDSASRVMLVGNLLITSGEITAGGELTSIKTDELVTVLDNIKQVTTDEYPQPYFIVANVGY